MMETAGSLGRSTCAAELMVSWVAPKRITGIAAMLAVGFWLAAGVAAAQEAAKPGLGPAIGIHKNLSDKEWPQLQNTPQRTGYSPTRIRPPYREVWHVDLSELDVDNKIQRTVQPVVAEGKVYVGCKNGRMFALDAKTGEVRWTFDAGGPINHTAGYADGKVFFACYDGCVYALEAGTGKLIWKFSNGRRFGFSTAVLLAAEKVFAVDRGGRLFALAPVDGKELWRYDAGAPVLQCPAWNAGAVFFADERLRVHAVKDPDGSRIWTSKPLLGYSFQGYWPVVVHGRVIVCSLQDDWHIPHDYEHLKWDQDPKFQSLFLLDEKTGQELPAVEHYMTGVHQGAVPPPAVTRDGLLVARWCARYLGSEDKHVASGNTLAANPSFGIIWVLQDIRDGGKRVATLEPDFVPGAKVPIAVGLGPGDETTIGSVFSDLVVTYISMGWREYGTGGDRLLNTVYSRAHGTYSLTDGRWYWEGICAPRNYGQQFSGGVAAVSAAGGFFYNTAWNEVQCHGSKETDK